MLPVCSHGNGLPRKFRLALAAAPSASLLNVFGSVVTPRRIFQVELEYSKHEYHSILRNTTLDRLYEENGRALGVQFTTDQEVLSSSSGESESPSCITGREL